MPGYIASLKDIDGKRGIFTILLTALILTIFEIVFFYKIVAPGVQQQMDSNLNNISKIISNKVNDATGDDASLSNITATAASRLVINDKANSVLKSLRDREVKLINDVNMYTKITGGVIIGLLVFILIALRSSVKKEAMKTAGSIDLKVPTQTALFSVFILISFQILFYFFSLGFKFPGTTGSEELMNIILESIIIK
jgi:hypothetical protein